MLKMVQHRGGSMRWPHQQAQSMLIFGSIDWAIIGSHVTGCALSPCLPRKDRRQKTKSGKFVKNLKDTLLLAAGGPER